MHDVFRSTDSRGRPVVSTEGCRGILYILRHPDEFRTNFSKLCDLLYRTFLMGFKAAVDSRDPRARYLLAENANPGLRRPSMRRYFFRLGFRMLGINHLGYELWRLPLQTR